MKKLHNFWVVRNRCEFTLLVSAQIFLLLFASDLFCVEVSCLTNANLAKGWSLSFRTDSGSAGLAVIQSSSEALSL